MFSRTSVVPRNGHSLKVCIAARISGCKNQKEQSLTDQIAHAKEVKEEMYQGPTDYVEIATKGKGERRDREELTQIENLLRKGTLDLLIVEDLGRLVRGAEAVRLLGVAVDHGVRVISPNDCIDTAEPTWEEDALSACRDHVGHNAHTSKRLKFKMFNRFKSYGGCTPRPIAGYILPERDKTDDDGQQYRRASITFNDWRKDDVATPTINEGLRRLRETLNCSAVADYFNGVGFSRGLYAKRKEWQGSDVREFYSNRLLGGFPSRGHKHSVKHHGSGKRVAVKNPAGPTYREFPHLAHVDIVELDELNKLLAEHNKNYRRRNVNGRDPAPPCAPQAHKIPWSACALLVLRVEYGVGRQWYHWESVVFRGSRMALLELDRFHGRSGG